MNEKQIKWLAKELKYLFISALPLLPMSDEEAENIVKCADNIVRVANGNEEVRSYVMDALELIDKLNRGAKHGQ